MPPKSMVKWNEEERERVAEQFALLRLSDPFSPTSDLFEKAQKECLSPDRFRSAINRTQEAKLYALCQQKYDTMMDGFRGVPLVVEKEVFITPKSDDEIIAEMPLDILCSVAVKRLINERMGVASLLSLVSASQADVVRTPTPSLPLVEKSQRPDKCRILIVGVYTQQSNDIRDKCPKDLDLQFIHGDRAARKIDTGADWVIIYKASHSWTHSIKASMNGSGDKVVYCKDGINGLCQKIVELRARWIAQRNHPPKAIDYVRA